MFYLKIKVLEYIIWSIPEETDLLLNVGISIEGMFENADVNELDDGAISCEADRGLFLSPPPSSVVIPALSFLSCEKLVEGIMDGTGIWGIVGLLEGITLLTAS